MATLTIRHQRGSTTLDLKNTPHRRQAADVLWLELCAVAETFEALFEATRDLLHLAIVELQFTHIFVRMHHLTVPSPIFIPTGRHSAMGTCSGFATSIKNAEEAI
ncbi:MAG: hypothetical protein M3069_03960 [Chloroflexota bacterium]|nr:hypothetical protein [Chloroflexota bacterium]